MALVASSGLVLHGTSGSRSPLVNWFTNEAKVALAMAPPRPSNHPFGQIPFLTDAGGVEVFESGAILMYIADKYGGAAYSTPEGRAKYTKWVVWSNSELDGLCFGAVPGDHRVRGCSMGNMKIKAVATLESILGSCEWLARPTSSLPLSVFTDHLVFTGWSMANSRLLTLRWART